MIEGALLQTQADKSAANDKLFIQTLSRWRRRQATQHNCLAASALLEDKLLVNRK